MNDLESKKYEEQIKKAILKINQLKSENEQLKQKKNEPIAIVGIGCRYPGDANDPDSFWKVIKDGVDATSEIPGNRWDNSKYYDPTPGTPGKSYVQRGGFLNDIEKFDNDFFNIPNREALYMDPQQRVLLEVSYEALENAGIDTSKMAGTEASAFIGYPDMGGYGKRHLYSNNPNTIDPYSIIGYTATAATGRISYFLGMRGANVALDTGCSASLVALHLACQSLRYGDSELALAGGVTLIMSPEYHIALSSINGLSPDGKCKTFDASANGFVRSEGCGVIVLKKLSDAVRDKDKIWAVIKGSAINQDGQSNGYTAPNVLAQIDAIKSALKNANINPNDVDFVETHGTGTPIGDPIEMEAIKDTYCKNRGKENPLLVGAVKTNFGHTESASGIAGVIKTALCLQNGEVPPNLHFNNPSPHIPWDDFAVKIPTETTEWKTKDSPRIGAVSSFGISGTNAHIIIEEAPKITEEKSAETKSRPLYALPVSAKTEEARKTAAKSYMDFLTNSGAPLAELCASAAYRHCHYKYRYLAVGRDAEELKASLNLCVEDVIEIPAIDHENTDHKVAFVYPGQGAQWIGMGQELYKTEKAFKDAIDKCEEAFKEYVDWSLKEELYKSESESRFKEIDVIQPVIFAIEIAITELWMDYGIIPDYVVGHSMGEAAAAYISGALSLKDAARVICERSKLMKKISGRGSMLAAELKASDAEALIGENKDKVSIAVSNSFRSTVLSGDTEILEAIAAKLEKKNIFNVFVKVDVASHSPQVDLIKEELLQILSPVTPGKSKIPMLSTVKNKLITGEELNAGYWVDNLREMVRFSEATQELINDGATIFIEMSPHPILSVPIEQNVDETKAENITVVPSILKNKDELTSYATHFGKLYSIGYPINWENIYSKDFSNVPLPKYPWQHKTFWLEMGEHEYAETDGLEQVAGVNDENKKDSFISELQKLESEEERKDLLVEKLKKIVAKNTGTALDSIKTDSDFKTVGVTSLIVIKLSMELEKTIGIKVQPTIFWTYSTFDTLSDQLLESLDLSKGESNTQVDDEDLSSILDELDAELENL